MSHAPKVASLMEVVEEIQAQTQAPKSDGWREETIRARVLAALGRPADLVTVAVLPLWDDHFRVNVWTSAGVATIPDSYFVTADERGTILRSEPPIQRRYWSPTG
ncbi:hypothetical protein [Frigoriglobus tundricola]|uniref:Uncharacterized protein n=1 Tax=Frigoriglobus tundricola TaxID=2774151 RepID=A0A6M5Z297_9BACT|nr:hypothetical protein [Frigoriglobus tundricola]QJX00339.1 hypothetical protein FTUN_7965 [Frigoriglobus tundricola]